MRSTFTKIFLSFWLTEILILVVGYFFLSSQFESNEIVYVSMFAMIQSNAREAMQAYEAGGCKALDAVPRTFSLENYSPNWKPAILFDSEGRALCETEDTSIYNAAVAKMKRQGYLTGERHGSSFIEGIDLKNSRGQRYFYLIRGTYPTQVYIPYREMAPRLLIGLIVSLLVTFVITMMITRPISSLREAAKQLAAGNLSARAKWPRGFLRFQQIVGRATPAIQASWPKERIVKKSGDELLGLVYDFNEMADRLESMVDAQMLLLRDVSHELRSPLARLSVALELAREEAQPGMEVQLDRIERETGRLNSLIGQLLSLSHLESTTRLSDNQPVCVREVIQELLPDMAYEAQQRNCRVSFLSDGLSQGIALVQGNRELLCRAMENVIRNAIAYTAEGTTVEIHLCDEQRAGSRFLVLEVKDYGPGVPDSALKTIFRPFYRLDLSRQRSTGGYGVGLAITERAVRLHGGYVTARNSPEGGLIVQMSLPFAEAKRA